MNEIKEDDTARKIVQDWVNENSYVVSFDGEIMVPAGNTLHANTLIRLFQKYHREKMRELSRNVRLPILKKGTLEKRLLEDPDYTPQK